MWQFRLVEKRPVCWIDHEMVLAGSVANPDSSYLCGSCRACSAACFWSTFKTLSIWQTAILLLPGISSESFRVCPLLGAYAKGGMGRLCQTALCWTRTGAALRRTLHPSRGDLEQSPAGHRLKYRPMPRSATSYWILQPVASAGCCSSMGCGACGAGAGFLTMASSALRLASMRM
jgi:hypothetical protein